MKIGVIGLGGIAQKAYLPTYSKMQDQAEFIFATRNQEVQTKLQNSYNLKTMKNNLQEVLAEKIDACFIHTATASHYELIKACLLHDVHVFVDKPISENLEQVHELQQLAKERNKLLMVGFNRRFAPMVEKLKQLTDKRMIFLQKNRAYSIQPTAFEIFDVFLHLVDTAVYLLDDPILQIKSTIRETQGNMETALLQLETATTTAILTMDLKSGANRESYQVNCLQGTYMVDDLVTFKSLEGDDECLQTFGDWTNILEKRGFEQQVRQFLHAVQTGDRADLRQENIAKSHEICQEMLRQLEESGN